MVIDPVCLFHGKRWSEHRCLVCCICYKDLTPEECAVDAEGTWDVCKGECARQAGVVELVAETP